MANTTTTFDGKADDWFLWPFARLSTAGALAIAAVATLIFFRVFPDVDVAVSRLFFQPQPCAQGAAAGAVCGYFPAQRSAVLNVIRDFFHVLPAMVALNLAVAVAVRQKWQLAPRDGFAAGALTAVVSLVIASLVIVHAALKNVWGRPRPYATDLFGGQFPFVPAGDLTQYCAKNCSFVSGEASGGFWLVAAAALTPPRWRRAALWTAFAVAVFIAGMRVTFGAHYLSDVLLAGMITLLVFSILAWSARH